MTSNQKGTSKYLFVDNRWISATYAVHRQVGRFDKHPDNPLLVADQPWEGGLKCYGTALAEGGKYRLWYQMLCFRHAVNRQFETGVGYAESDDGIRWRKPLCGVDHPVAGPTNLVVLSAGRAHLCSPSVVHDRHTRRRSRRYKMMFYDTMEAEALERYGSPLPMDPAVPGWNPVVGEGMFMAYSRDGIAWKRDRFPVFGGPSDVAAMTQLDDGNLQATFKTSYTPDRHFRVIARAISKDGEKWSTPRVILEPDWHDPPGTEFYGMSGFEYFGNLIGLVCVYHNAPDDKSLDIQLASCVDRNTDSWVRGCDRKPLLTGGASGTWDAGGIYVASHVLMAPPHDPQRLWLYYSGISARHDDMRYKEWSIGLATLRIDGFAAMRAGYFPGFLVTNPVMATSNRLHLNADCRHGYLQVRVRDAHSDKVLAESRPVTATDSLDLVVPWEGKAALKGKQVVIEFQMRKCSLYSFWF